METGEVARQQLSRRVRGCLCFYSGFGSTSRPRPGLACLTGRNTPVPCSVFFSATSVTSEPELFGRDI
ncbi:hypothetical protein AOLI_G00079070 [Acnodon oligacanthus]